MSRTSQIHTRTVQGIDSSNQVNLPGTGGGYGGGAVVPSPTGSPDYASGWPPPTSLSVVTAGAGTSTMTWVAPTPDPSDGTTLVGYRMYRDGNLLFNAAVTSPQVDSEGVLVVGQVYNYTVYAYDSAGKLTAADQFAYTHS